MRYLIGIDDTDNLESRGTGHRARQLAQFLIDLAEPLRITRHQLLVVPEIPYTSHNSSAAICIQNRARIELGTLFERVKALMMSDFIAGSDHLNIGFTHEFMHVAGSHGARPDHTHNNPVARSYGAILTEGA